MLPYLWNILIITNNYTDINNKLQLLLEQCNIPHTKYCSRVEANYSIDPVYIRIRYCRDAQEIERFRGYKADTIFTETEWVKDLEVQWRLKMICSRFGMIKSTNFLYHILNNEVTGMYNYKEEMIKDIKNYIITNNWVENNYDMDHETYYEVLDKLYDELWNKDEITGNGENYYASEAKCAEFVMQNLPLYFAAARDLDDFPKCAEKWINDHAAQHMDATIRCYLLRDCLEEACEEL